MEYIASQVTEYIDILHIVLGGGCIFFRCYSSTLSKHILTSLLIKSFYSSKVVFLWEQRRKLIHGLFRRLYVESMYSILHKNPNSDFFQNSHLSILRGTVFGF
jgi:hypothetical protein